ncbi:uncharacterized protein [Nicotiana sylvestris]|uniref:uncharacterized protein n=1 Tax=Nicotiana sylvestris TaxID=4096 RepID=UPI00388CBFF5
MPDISQYNGTTDPNKHVTSYTCTIKGNDLEDDDIESVLLKKFGETLSKGAMISYHDSTPNSIDSFAMLADAFVKAHAGAIKVETRKSDLFKSNKGITICSGRTGATVTSVVASSSRSTPAHAMAPAEKPGKFFGIDFKRWQMKMLFYLTTLSLQRFIKEDPPVMAENTLDDERLVKYKTEDAGLKKFVATRFLDFKMIDTRSVITQVQELQVIVHDLLAEGMVINEAFQVAAFIEKLPPLWKDFKNYLKRKRKEMTLEDLIVRLRIEEDNKNAEKKSRGNSTIMGANVVEEAPQNKKRKKASGPKNYPSKKKFKGNCHNCRRSGHKAVDCRAPKNDKKKKKQANMVEDEMEDLYYYS